MVRDIFSKTVQAGFEVHSVSNSVSAGALRRGKRPMREVDPPPPQSSSAEVTKKSNCNSAPPACLRGVDRGSCTSTVDGRPMSTLVHFEGENFYDDYLTR